MDFHVFCFKNLCFDVFGLSLLLGIFSKFRDRAKWKGYIKLTEISNPGNMGIVVIIQEKEISQSNQDSLNAQR